MISTERIAEEGDERLSTSSGEGSKGGTTSGVSLSTSSSSSSSSSSAKKEIKKWKKTSKKVRQAPERFFGDGVTFKGKLIGIKDVAQPRGETMTQEALQELKLQKKSSGEHKQKMIINIALDGLQLKDEKTKMLLYLHPVHKISFISQDAADARAFGYIYGSPDNKHTFFAIKTEKAAQQVVMCMRDLFQVAFELKKDEILLYRQQQQQQTAEEADSKLSSSSNSSCHSDSSPSFSDGNDPLELNSCLLEEETTTTGVLLDLGMQELQKVLEKEDRASSSSGEPEAAPINDPFFSDPWGYLRSMSVDESEMDKSDPFDTDVRAPVVPLFCNVTTDHAASSSSSSSSTSSFSGRSVTVVAVADDPFNTSFVDILHVPVATSTPMGSGGEEVATTVLAAAEDKYAALSDVLTDDDNNELSPLNVAFEATTVEASSALDTSRSPVQNLVEQLAAASSTSVFSDLDPLGKDRPFVDKKDFFYDIKHPPKKVLKDLIAENGYSNSSAAASQFLELGTMMMGGGVVPLPTTPSPSPSQVSSAGSSDDDILLFQAPPSLPLPVPPTSGAPLARPLLLPPPSLPSSLPRPCARLSSVSPASSSDDATMASVTPSPTGDVGLLLPPPPPRTHPPPPPVPLRPTPHLSSPPIPIPSRRLPATSSSSFCGGSSSPSPCANRMSHQDANNNRNRWTIADNDNEVSSRNLANRRRPGVFLCPPESNPRKNNFRMTKAGDIFRKADDPFADDDFFAALDSGGDNDNVMQQVWGSDSSMKVFN